MLKTISRLLGNQASQKQPNTITEEDRRMLAAALPEGITAAMRIRHTNGHIAINSTHTTLSLNTGTGVKPLLSAEGSTKHSAFARFGRRVEEVLEAERNSDSALKNIPPLMRNQLGQMMFGKGYKLEAEQDGNAKVLRLSTPETGLTLLDTNFGKHALLLQLVVHAATWEEAAEDMKSDLHTLQKGIEEERKLASDISNTLGFPRYMYPAGFAHDCFKGVAQMDIQTITKPCLFNISQFPTIEHIPARAPSSIFTGQAGRPIVTDKQLLEDNSAARVVEANNAHGQMVVILGGTPTPGPRLLPRS